MLHLARLRAAAAVGVRLGRVVVVTGLGAPRRVDLRIECPVGKIHTLHGVGEGAALQRVRREPQLSVPGADAIARLVLGNFERQHALRPERFLALLVGHELRRPAELAALCLPCRIEHGDRLTALAFDVTLLDLPAPRVVAEAPQRRHQVVLDDLAGVGVELRRRGGAAERAHQRLLGRIPYRFRAAGGARELLLRDGFPERRWRVHDRPNRLVGGTHWGTHWGKYPMTRHFPSASRSIDNDSRPFALFAKVVLNRIWA